MATEYFVEVRVLPFDLSSWFGCLILTVHAMLLRLCDVQALVLGGVAALTMVGFVLQTKWAQERKKAGRALPPVKTW
jgi:hypothetical protein